jgi:4-hydroxy-2-oxoheptanedioate aldolase
VVFDLQHGEGTVTDASDGIAGVVMRGKAAADLGCELAIMPMINSVEDARKLVDTLKYPPLGGRSWGPARAVNLHSLTMDEYRLVANEQTIVLAMIETRGALDAADEILDVPGLDGVFIGPSDLSISLSGGQQLDHALPAVLEAKKAILASAKRRKKIAAIFCASGRAAAENAHMGFDIMAIASDWAFLSEGARLALTAARGSVGNEAVHY